MISASLGWTAFVIDVLALWALGSKGKTGRLWGVIGMAAVNALFVAQGLLDYNWSLVAVSTLSTTLQTRAAYNWRKSDG